MKTRLILISMMLVSFMTSCSNAASVIWTEGETDPATGRAVNVITVVNAPEGTDWALRMTSNHMVAGAVDGTEGTIEMHHGCLYKMTPADR